MCLLLRFLRFAVSSEAVIVFVLAGFPAAPRCRNGLPFAVGAPAFGVEHDDSFLTWPSYSDTSFLGGEGGI